jgi:hypothetical protein
MTLSEAITVMKIMATADGWCSQCGPSLIKDFGEAFPQFADIAENFDIETLKEAYNKKRDENDDKLKWTETKVWELD